MDFKKSKYINRGDYIKIDKNSSSVQGVKHCTKNEVFH